MITPALFRTIQMPAWTVPAIFQPGQHLHSPHLPFTCSFFWRFFPFVSCLKTSLEMLQEWNGCRGLLTRGVRAFQMWLRWSMHIKQKVTARVNSEVKCYDYESSWCWVEQLGTCYKEREILALFELVSSWPLRLVRPELLCAGYHPISSLRCTFRAAKWCQQNDL